MNSKTTLKEKNANNYLTHTKTNKGITLIALIITIVVLLILAVVVIQEVRGEGIIARAQQSKTEYEKKAKEEERILGSMESILDKIEKGTTYSVWDGKSIEVPIADKTGNWHIYTAEQFKFFADFVNEELTEEEKEGLEITENTVVYLESDLDLGAVQKDGVLISGTQWEPIGKSTSGFIGVFEGNNHIIKGIYVNDTEDYTGLFKKSTNTIKNITIKDSYIEGSYGVGAIVGNGNEIYDCNNYGTKIEGKKAVVRRNSRNSK